LPAVEGQLDRFACFRSLTSEDVWASSSGAADVLHLLGDGARFKHDADDGGLIHLQVTPLMISFEPAISAVI